MAAVPKASKLGDGGTLAIRSVRREQGPGKPKILVDVAAPENAKAVLFAEGPTPQWALPLPEPARLLRI